MPIADVRSTVKAGTGTLIGAGLTPTTVIVANEEGGGDGGGGR